MSLSLGLPAATPAEELRPGPTSSLADWLAWQERIHGGCIMLGLERCRRVAADMGLLDRREYTVVSVAGTNGKGSSICMLESILRRAGYRVGAYTSPHLCRYNERVRIDGALAEDAALCASFHEVEQARGSVQLTYFEFGTLAALNLFRERHIDVALLEVGLGGRLDAVNVLDADLALVTSIGIDHVEWLGRTRESIGREKAGIMRPGNPAVCSSSKPPHSLRNHAQAIGAPLYLAGHDFDFDRHDGGWNFTAGDRRLEQLPLPHPYSLCQVRNAAGALMALEQLAGKLPVDETAIRAGLRGACPRGRFQLVPGEPPLILDVAHNLQAVQELGRSLRTLPDKGRLHVVIGMLQDKDHAKVLGELANYADVWHLVGIEGARGCAADFLAGVLAQSVSHHGSVHEQPNVADALASIRSNHQPGDRVLVTGSFITVGAALEHLHDDGS